ncbi:MAG: leucine-rich repeat domain-containing protein [Bacteroidales bacterium]|nr:leucine-rich repeat domain-containing protein [Bacteroidales bacterium]
MKKNISILLIATLLSVVNVFAQSGTTGPLTWDLDNGTLTISGNGAMPDYALGEMPWFEYQGSIDSVVIKNGVTSIGGLAFYGCKSLYSVAIPNSVTIMGDEAFSDCTSLAAFVVESGNNNYASEDGVLFNKDKTTLIYCPAGKKGTYTVPNSVTTIGQYAFSTCEGLISVVISNNVKNIEDGAFSYCKNLTSVTLSGSVAKIGSWAFAFCYNLVSITNLNPVPISINFNAFDGIAQDECTLSVPKNAIYAYTNAHVWKKFNIVGIE